jgi:hypothetical protein
MVVMKIDSCDELCDCLYTILNWWWKFVDNKFGNMYAYKVVFWNRADFNLMWMAIFTLIKPQVLDPRPYQTKFINDEN